MPVAIDRRAMYGRPRPGVFGAVDASPPAIDAHGHSALVPRRILMMQAALVAISAPLYPMAGISIAWRPALAHAAVLVLFLGVWAWYARGRGLQKRPHIPDALLATLLLILMTNIAAPAQYAGVALRFPLVDPWLAAADATIGIHVPTLVEWTRAHPALTGVLIASYHTLLIQFILPPIVLGLVYRDRAALWQYVFHFHFCLLVTVVGVALLPAACAFSYYGFSSLLDQTRFIAHFETLRAGAFHELRFDDLEGLISFPSFHVAGGMMVTWAFRQRRGWLAGLVVLNTLMIASTVLTGAHYAIDVVVTALLFLSSLYLWRRWGAGDVRALLK